MASENIQELINFWKSFERLTTFTISDMNTLSSKMGHAMQSIQELEKSRENWKKRAITAESELKEIKEKWDAHIKNNAETTKS